LNSFKAIALEWFEQHMLTKTANHQARVMRAFERDLFPFIGNLPIKEVDAPLVLECLRRIEHRGHLELANRTKTIVGQVFRFAVATGRASLDPNPSLKGALKTHEVKHLASILSPAEVGELMLAIDGYDGTPVVKAALKLSPLLFCRPGELRNFEWSEVNWPECRIEIPGAKMKMRQDHFIPLSSQAQAIIEEIRPLTGAGRYIFPSARGGSRPLSENGVRTALRTMGYDNSQITPHGFRAMARTLLDEELGFRADWIEHQLAHAVKDPNGRAYNRTTHLAQRVGMMQSWADYLDNLKAQAKAGNVIAASFGKTQ
ncbi:MAG: site-specific integrase, partial [Cellvibrionaceae bacterium]|nr:site-specific integrase [Cellvibrionaceae bacterium]